MPRFATVDDVQEPEAAPEGEYDLRIVRAEDKESKAGNNMVECIIVIEEPGIDAQPIRHYLLDWEGIPEDQQRIRKLEYKRFCACFNIPEDFDDAEELVGQTGRSYVTQEVSERDDNVYNRLRLPRLKKGE